MENIDFEFCEKENEKLYIKTFLGELSDVIYEKMMSKLSYFKEYSLFNFRNSKHTELLDRKAKLWEVKIKIDGDVYRLLGTWVKNIFYIAHAFKKKTNKTPNKEIKLANKNIEDYFNKTICD